MAQLLDEAARNFTSEQSDKVRIAIDTAAADPSDAAKQGNLLYEVLEVFIEYALANPSADATSCAAPPPKK
jgi:hypothetical protein